MSDDRKVKENVKRPRSRKNTVEDLSEVFTRGFWSRNPRWLDADLSARSGRLRHVAAQCRGSNRPRALFFCRGTSRVRRVAYRPPALDRIVLSSSAMFPSSNTFPTTSTGSGQEQRPPFPHSHSHPVQYNGSPFTVAGMSSLNQSTTSPSVRGGPLGMSMGSSLGMGSPLSESLSQSRSHYQPGYLMVRRHPLYTASLLSDTL